MLDAIAYRANETTAKRAIASWRLSNINDPYIFQNQGFPVRTDSVLDLVQILDTMQEERFDYYMGEIGGFTDEEANFFADVCIDYTDFYQKTFERDRVIIPLSTMIAHYVIYRKLIGYNSKFSRVLEFGPGCGYLSFFLRHHAYLEDYSQIESTESFYLLQSHINSHVFGSRFSEHAISQQALADHNFYIAKMRWHGDFHYEDQKIINVPRAPICNHYPWWRLGDVADKRYDIISTNANLNEFSSAALFQYLSVIRDVLADDGAIIAQCLGGGAPTYDNVFAIMKSVGFVPVVLVAGDADPGRIFVVSNAVFVGPKHPLYSQYVDKKPTFHTWDREIDFVNRMYFINEEHKGKKRIRSTSEILDLIRERIEVHATRDSGGMLPKHLHGNGAANDGSAINTLAGPFSLAISSEKTALRKITIPARRAEVNRLRLIGEVEARRDKNEPKVVLNLNRDTQELAAKEKAQLEERAAQLAAELQAITQSTSWRITAPLRALVMALAKRIPISLGKYNSG